MHLVNTPHAALEPVAAEDYAGVPMVVLFADGTEIDGVREHGGGRIGLSSGCSFSEDDTYLILPDDIGIEIVDIFADGDLELVREALRDGICAVGHAARRGDGRFELAVEDCRTPLQLLDADLPYAGQVTIARGADPLQELNMLPHLQCTMVSALLDDEGLEQLWTTREYVGVSWRPPRGVPALQTVDPTYVWARRVPDRGIGIEAALFLEDEELTLSLRPALLAPRVSSH